MTDTKDFVPDFTVRIGMWDAETTVVTVRRKRHTARWDDDPESKVTYCNNCGSPFIIGDQCSQCGMPQSGNPA